MKEYWVIKDSLGSYYRNTPNSWWSSDINLAQVYKSKIDARRSAKKILINYKESLIKVSRTTTEIK